MMLRIAVIGCGWVARNWHVPALAGLVRQDRRVVLDACCDLDFRLAERTRNMFGFRKSHTDYREILTGRPPDAVILAVPETETFRIAAEVLQAGIPLLLEKPPGLTARETRALYESARRGRVPHQVAWNRRYMPSILALQQQVLQTHQTESPHRATYEMYRINRDEPQFVHTAIHGMDALRFLIGSGYNYLEISYKETIYKGKPVTNFSLSGNLMNGTLVSLAFLPVAGLVGEHIAIHTPGNSWFTELPVWDRPATPGHILHYSGNKETIVPPGGKEDPFGFHAQLNSFIDALINERSPVPDLASSLQTMEIMDVMKARGTVYRNQVAG